jgi:hypothetical protein
MGARRDRHTKALCEADIHVTMPYGSRCLRCGISVDLDGWAEDGKTYAQEVRDSMRVIGWGVLFLGVALIAGIVWVMLQGGG